MRRNDIPVPRAARGTALSCNWGYLQRKTWRHSRTGILMRKKELGGLFHMRRTCGSLDREEIAVRLGSPSPGLQAQFSTSSCLIAYGNDKERRALSNCLPVGRSAPFFSGGIIPWKCTEAKSWSCSFPRSIQSMLHYQIKNECCANCPIFCCHCQKPIP